jgi:hopanoid biosynthesis associated RND transporter like protein HpnN
MNFVQQRLQGLLMTETKHPWVTFWIALFLTAVSIFYTVRHLGFQTGQMDLISSEHRLVKLSESVEQFEDLDTFLVAIENQDVSRSLKFLHALVPLLESDHENYMQIFYRMEPKLFRPWALLYLEKEDLRSIRENVQQHHYFIKNLVMAPSLFNFFRQVNEEMASRMVHELFTGFLDEKAEAEKPLNLDFLIRTLRAMDRWLGGETFVSPWESFLIGKSQNDPWESYFWTENRQYLLLFVTPTKKEKSFVNTKHALDSLRMTIEKTQVDFPGIRVGVTGPKALDTDEMGMAFYDMNLATILSIVGLTILLVLFWRGFRRPLLELITLLVALSLTFGLTTLLIGHLNILSITFAPLLLGLGIDYGVHWFARYHEEEEARRSSKKEALQTTMVQLGPGILLAGFAASLSFFPLVLTRFKGLMELGIICSVGMAIIILTTLCLLPVLILIFNRRKQDPPHISSTVQVQSLFKLTKLRSLIILTVAGVGFMLSLWGAGKVRFDLNMLKLQSQGAESVIWEKKLIKDSRRPSMYGIVLARSLEEVRSKTAALQALPTVSETQSVKNLLPDQQKEKINLLREIKPFLTDVGPLQLPEGSVNLSELDEVFGRIRFKMMDSNQTRWDFGKPLESQMKQVRDLIDVLRQRFRSLEKLHLSRLLKDFEKAFIQDLNDKIDLLLTNINSPPMEPKDLPESMLQRFVGKDHLFPIRVFPSLSIWEPENLGKFVNDLQSVDPDAIGDPVTLYVFTRAFRDGCIKAALYAVILIVILLLLSFRSLLSSVVAMAPLVVGTAWTLGLMYLLGINLNLANSLFLPLVVGAGVEYGIIVVQRWRQRKDDANVILPRSTAIGVILAGLTTTVGFGSLTLSRHQGIYSLGLLTTIGSLSVLIAAIFFLPALFQILTKVSKKESLENSPP